MNTDFFPRDFRISESTDDVTERSRGPCRTAIELPRKHQAALSGQYQTLDVSPIRPNQNLAWHPNLKPHK